jgi:hypothetical protein
MVLRASELAMNRQILQLVRQAGDDPQPVIVRLNT